MGRPDRQQLERRASARLELKRRQRTVRNSRNAVFGFVCPAKGFTHAIQQQADGSWLPSIETPDLYLPAKLERVVTSTKRFIIIIGGRGSAKSVGVADICLVDAKDNGAKTYCLREYQSSIKNSIQSLLKDETKRLEFDDFEAKGVAMFYKDREVFEFAGLARNVDSIKSAHGFKRFYVEEAQFISEDSLTALTPTARNKPNRGLPREAAEAEEDTLAGVSIVFVANPGSSADPFSQRFIVPFQDAIARDGYYEDDLHLVVKMNYNDNPWYVESGLETERQFDKKFKSAARYSHVWDGAYSDEVENSIIPVEWFDAAIDAHIKLGFKPQGAKFVTFDPSDRGDDAKGLAYRHGSVYLDVCEKLTGDAYDATDWATEYAIDVGADYFNWDCDGMGALLRRQVAKNLAGTRVQYEEYKGSGSVDRPDAPYDPKAIGGKPRPNKETFRNKRSQYYITLMDRFYNTFRAVVHGDYVDPDEMLSLSSGIKCLDQLRAEVCRIPLQENNSGYLQIMSKKDMKFIHKIESPNMADCMKMSLAINVVKQGKRKQATIPGIQRRNMSRAR